MRPRHEPEVERAMARNILEAIAEGDRIEREGLRHYCHRMMTTCHRAAGFCECDRVDAIRSRSQKGEGK